MSLKSLLTFNGYTDKINKYEDTKGVDYAGLEKSRLAVFDIVKNNELDKATRVYQGHKPVDTATDALGKELMTTDEILDKGEKLRSAIEDGWVYTLDTETFGVTDEQLAKEIASRKRTGHPNITAADLKTVKEINSKAHVMTELYMSKQRYINGQPHKMVDNKWIPGVERIEVFRTTNTKDLAVMNELLSVARNNPGAGDLLFNLKRAAGSYGAYKPNAKYPSSWNPNGDIFDKSATYNGLLQMSSHAENEYGKEGFNKTAQKLYDTFISAIDNDKNAIFETLNGEEFDWPVIFDYFKQGGVEVNEDAKKKILSRQVDAQKLINATGFRGVIYDDLNKRKDELMAEAIALYKSGDTEKAMMLEAESDKISLGITNSHIAEAAKFRGADIDIENTHVARADVAITQASLEAYHKPLLDRIDEIKSQTEGKVGPSTSTLYTANRAIVFDRDKDIYFSNTIGPDGNTYNPIGMEAGHSYKLSVYNNIEKFKTDGVDLTGKKILEMEDQYENLDGTRRRSYLVVDSDKEIQSRILDTGFVETHKESKVSKDAIKVSTENALRDRARNEKAAWFSVNSDKGFKSFETYLGVLEDFRGEYRNGKQALNERDAIENLLKSNNIGEIKRFMPGLFSNKPGHENSIIQERAVNFLNLYDDLSQNYDYYKFLRDSVNEKMGSTSKFAEASGIEVDSKYTLDYEYNKAKTAMLYSAKNNLDDEMIKKLDEDKIIERFYLENQNAPIATRTQNYAEELSSYNLSPSQRLAEARADLFESNFGFEFDPLDKDVKEAILGYTAIEKDSRTLNQLDIVGEKAKYTKIRTDSLKNIETDLDKLLNIDAIRNNKNGKSVARERYLKSVSKDLLKRNIITQDDYKSVMKVQNVNPYQRASLLSNAIYSNRVNIESIAKEIGQKNNFAENILDKKFNYNLTSEDKAGKLKNYLENMHMTAIKSPNNNVETYLGINKSKMLKENMTETLMKNVTEGLENIIPEISTFSAADDSKNGLVKTMLMDEFGYTQNNADLFINNILNNEANKEFKFAGSGNEVKGGVVNLIKNIDNEGYLITAPKSRQHRIEQMLLEQSRYGYDLDELKKVAMVFKMDKVSTEDGIRFIKSSNAASKAITQNVVAQGDWKTKSLTFEIRDTLDQTLISFKNQYERGLKEMSLGNLEKANSIVNWSRREINENKSRSSTVITHVDGKGFIKMQKLNLSDSMLNKKYDLSDIVYSLDTVLEGENNPLKEKLNSAIGENRVNKLLENIERFKDKPYKANALSFENLDVGAKLWFSLNTTEIADKLLTNESFMENSSGMGELLNAMKEHGSSLFYSKESGEAFKGIINLNPTHKYVAGSHLSGVARPLINQVLNSKPMTISDMLLLSKSTLGLDLANEKAIEKEFGIKFGRSYMTEEFADIEQLSKAKGMHQGFSAKIKYMNAEEFSNRINAFMDTDKEWVSKLVQDHKLSESQVKNIVEGIGNVTSIYEDSGAIDPALARIFEQRGVTTETLENNKTYEIGKTYKGKEIIGQDGNKLYLQNKEKYYDVKLAFGYSEKAEFHAYNAKSNTETLVASKIFKRISGGASVILNPNLAKHEAFNTMFTLYSNAIGESINTDEEMKAVNDIFKKYMPDHKHEVRNIGNRYSLIEGARDPNAKFNGLEAMNNIVEDLKKQGDFGSRFTKKVSEIEKENIGFGDFSLMSDNTIEKPFEFIGDKRDGGAKVNYRSQQAIGIFLGDDPINELGKYRTVNGISASNPLQALIDKDINQLMSDKKFIKDMRQSSNIGSALLFSELSSIERTKSSEKYFRKNADLYKEYDDISKKARVVELDIRDAVPGSSQMSAVDIPSAFSMERNGTPVNAYKIKLNNMTLENPIYNDLAKLYRDKNKRSHIFQNKSLDDYVSERGIKKTIDEIYIPAMDANRISKDKYVLTEVQKTAADLLNTLHGIEEGEYGGRTLDQMRKRANDLLGFYSESLRFELTDKSGFYKRSLNIRSENSARFKVANVIAPVVDKNGQYLNNMFKDKATKIVNGKVQYRAVQVVNPSDIFGSHVNESYTNIGRQLVHDNIDSSDDVLKMLKQYGHGNTLDQVKASIKNADPADGIFRRMGQEYLETIGFNSLIMRDPAMLSTSYQTARTYVSNQVTKGSTWIDAVSAKWMNADGDGDEINAFYHMLTQREEHGFELRNEADEVSQALVSDVKNREGANIRKFEELIEESKNGAAAQLEKTSRTLKGYTDYILNNLRADDFKDGVDYIKGKTEIGNLLSRFLKGSIGQVSNPNYYLKAATSYFVNSRGYDVPNLALQRNIQTMTDLTEQSLIDIKSIKSLEEANAIANLAGSYRMNMDLLGMLGKQHSESRQNAMTQMVEQVGKLLVEKNKADISYTGMDAKTFFGDSADAKTARSEMVGRILSQDRSMIKSGNIPAMEEILMDSYKVLQDNNSNRVFFDSAIRQTDLAVKGYERLTGSERTHRALNAIGIGGDKAGRSKIFNEASAENFLQHTPIVNDRLLFRGDIIHSSNIDSAFAPGVYKVDSIFTSKKGEPTVKLIDLSNENKNSNKIFMSGKNFETISEKLQHFDSTDYKYVDTDELIKSTRDDLYNAYSKRALESLEGAEQVFGRNYSTNHLNNEVLDEVERVYNKEHVEEFLTDVEILKNNKLATNEELTNMRREMNEAIKNKGSKEYRETRKAEMLKLGRVQELGITSANFDRWEAGKFNTDVRNATRKAYKDNLEQEKIIQEKKILEEKDDIIKADDEITKARREMNEDIKRKGSTPKESKFSMGKMFNKAKTAFNEMSSAKQKMLAGGAIAATALGALALSSSGNNSLHADTGNYKKEDRDADRVKVREPKAPQTNYSEVGNNESIPMSDSRFYANQNNGLAVKVSGDAPENASPRHASNIIELMMGGGSANVNTSFNDSRTKPSSRDVDDMMSDATY